jgi:glycosyltransferase (activator-dependent family)
MRVLFCTLPQNTHFLTMAPLAWAVRTAGHEVRVASLPGFTGAVTQAGLTAAPVGTDPDAASDSPEERAAIRRGLPKPYDVAERLPAEVTWTEEMRDSYEMMVTYAFGEDNAPMIAGLVDFARHWQPDLVIWEPFTYAGPIAAKACGAAHARLLFTMDVLGVTHEWVHRNGVEDPLVDWLTAAAREYGFAFSEDMVSGQFTIDQLAASLRVSADLHYVPMQHVPYGGPAVVPDWLWAPPERPRVALTMGLSATEYFDGYTFSPTDILDALADLDIEVVATIAEAEQENLARVPDNARLVPYVPLHALAPTCAAVIHHGGFGTLSTIALHAVPQLVLPYHFEGPLLARKLAEQGAGLAVHSDLATGQTVRDGLLRLLGEPTFREHASRLRDEMRALPTPNQLVPQLEELTAKYR